MKNAFIILILLSSAAFLQAQSKGPDPDRPAVEKIKGYFGRALRYPSLASEQRIFGRTIIAFKLSNNHVLDTMFILKQTAGGIDEEVRRILRGTFNDRRLELPDGNYAICANFQLKDGEKLLVEKQRKIRFPKNTEFLFTIDVIGYVPQRKISWIIDRWPQANFSNDLKGQVRSVKAHQVYLTNTGDSIHWELDFNALSKMYPKPATSLGKRADTVFYSNKEYLISIFNSRGQPITVSNYGSDRVLTRRQHFFYRHRRCIEERCTFYANTGETRILIDRFEYDKAGRRIKEIYGVNDASSQVIIYAYEDWDERGNWRKAVRKESGKVTHTLTRMLEY